MSDDALAVVPAKTEDIPFLAEMLARAFREDPFIQWLVTPGENYEKNVMRFFETMMRRVMLPRGHIHTTADRAGAALWVHPRGWHMGALDQLLFLPLLVRVSGPLRAFAVLRGLGEIETQHPREPHYYLFILGVDPDRQGGGIGSGLMRETLDRCDAEETPVYIETANERTLTLYNRYEFSLLDEVQISGGPKMWCMWREPQKTG